MFSKNRQAAQGSAAGQEFFKDRSGDNPLFAILKGKWREQDVAHQDEGQ